MLLCPGERQHRVPSAWPLDVVPPPDDELAEEELEDELDEVLEDELLLDELELLLVELELEAELLLAIDKNGISHSPGNACEAMFRHRRPVGREFDHHIYRNCRG